MNFLDFWEELETIKPLNLSKFRSVERVELEKLLPNGLEKSALRYAIYKLREGGHNHVAEILAGYEGRLAGAGQTGW